MTLTEQQINAFYEAMKGKDLPIGTVVEIEGVKVVVVENLYCSSCFFCKG
jgi:hypothetical protein